MKLVVDTNVLISGSLWRGAAARLVDALLDGEATFYASEGLFAELADVLAREKFRARLRQAGQDEIAIVAGFREVARAIEPAAINIPPALRDPDDVHVLA